MREVGPCSSLTIGAVLTYQPRPGACKCNLLQSVVSMRSVPVEFETFVGKRAPVMDLDLQLNPPRSI
ncbi:hypothetical protein J6590_042905 [Homalodisca vitripennis]|nr:hypothetical protein J6590_042905 [Homalodisca vitripennis]